MATVMAYLTPERGGTMVCCSRINYMSRMSSMTTTTCIHIEQAAKYALICCPHHLRRPLLHLQVGYELAHHNCILASPSSNPHHQSHPIKYPVLYSGTRMSYTYTGVIAETFSYYNKIIDNVTTTIL